MQTQMPEQPQRFSLKDLCVRYSLSTAGLYKRLTVAGLSRRGSGRPAFFSVAEVALLDRLHQHVAQGGRLKSFQPQVPASTRFSEAQVEELRAVLTELAQGVIAWLTSPVSIAYLESLLPAEEPCPKTEPVGVLGPLRVFQKAYENKQPLSSDQVAHLLKVRPQTLNRRGQYFENINFTFTRLPKSQRNAPVFWQIGRRQHSVG